MAEAETYGRKLKESEYFKSSAIITASREKKSREREMKKCIKWSKYKHVMSEPQHLQLSQ